MSDTPRTIQDIINGSSHCLVRDGGGVLHEACKVKISDLLQLERELTATRAALRVMTKALLKAVKPFRHDAKCKLFPDPYDEREPAGPCTCGAINNDEAKP